MSSLFIALQCYQCSTMQVKQQKKSSNKWTCAVCNHKQSVRKVFAQGYMAKDIRKFVQSFNMSRKFAEESIDYEIPLVDSSHVADESSVVDQHMKKRRTDWSEYINKDEDPDLNLKVAQASNDKHLSHCTWEGIFEPKIVTELPKELFKRPKFSDKIGADKSEASHGSHIRKGNKHNYVQGVRGNLMARRATTAAAERCKLYEIEDLGDAKWSPQQQQKKFPTIARVQGSKWSKYVTEEVDEFSRSNNVTFTDNLELMGHCHSDLTEDATDQKVEEEVHPDFT